MCNKIFFRYTNSTNKPLVINGPKKHLSSNRPMI